MHINVPFPANGQQSHQMLFKVTVSIVFLQRIGESPLGIVFRFSFQKQSPPELFCQKVFLKILQYAKENTYVGVSFNKVAGIKPPTLVLFCEYCKIFKNSIFHRPPFRRARSGVGGGFPCLLLKIIKNVVILGKRL